MPEHTIPPPPPLPVKAVVFGQFKTIHGSFPHKKTLNLYEHSVERPTIGRKQWKQEWNNKPEHLSII